MDSMAVDANALYVQTTNAGIFALNLADGMVRWSSSLGLSLSPYTQALMLVTGGMVFTDYGASGYGSDHLYALRASDGRRVWDTPYSARIAAMTASDSALYVMLNSGELSVLNLLNGTVIWTHRSPLTSSMSVSNNTTGNIMIDQSAIYLLLSDNVYPYNNLPLQALSAKDGKTLWADQTCAQSTPASTPGALTPTLGNGRCYWTSRSFQTNMRVSLLLIDD